MLLHCLPLFFWLWSHSVTAAWSTYSFAQGWPQALTQNASITSYIGGNASDHIYSMVLSPEGDIFIAGNTASGDFYPLTTTIPVKQQDMFIMKLPRQSTGKGFVLILQGSQFETIRQLRFGPDGELWFVGESNSSDLPVSNPKYAWNGSWDAYFGKVDSHDGTLLFSGYFGGSDIDYGHSIDISDARQLAIGGETWSKDFPITESAFMRHCGATSCSAETPQQDGFITVFNSLLPESSPVYSTYFGGSQTDGIHSIEFDLFGHLHVAGNTASSDLPLRFPFQKQYKGNNDGFYLRLAPSQNKDASLLVSTYIGGRDEDRLNVIHLDQANNIWLGGYSHSVDWPVTLNALDRSCGDTISPCSGTGQADAVIVRIAHDDADVLQYSSFWGGTGDEEISAISSDVQSVFFAGNSSSGNFPVTTATLDLCLLDACRGVNHGFLLQLERSTQRLFMSERIAGNSLDILRTAISENGRIWLGGSSKSSNLASANAFDTLCGSNGSCDGAAGDAQFDGILLSLQPALGASEIISGGDRAQAIPSNKQSVNRRRGEGLWLILVLLLGLPRLKMLRGCNNE